MQNGDNNRALVMLQERVVGCRRCPRLVEYCRGVAERKRRAYLAWEYWGQPVPSFGDPAARVLVVGLAPGAHGSNRTGRMFTGDGSGNFLYRVLHHTGFASQPTAVSRDDGLRLEDLYITAAVRCAPPGNKPTPEEFANCRPYLEQELELLRGVRVVVALGKLAHDAYLRILQSKGAIARRSGYPFRHGAVHRLGHGLPVLVDAYHPSQQNTLTGKLTEAMFRQVFRKISRWLATGSFVA
ncbi:MAG: uracil-DNA glycosylase [Acidobacteria bacterium]|nr:uracil-DNA glycosylase [Acidobacteriota bacterium]